MDALAASEFADSVALLGASPPHIVLSHVATLSISKFLAYDKIIIIPDMDRLALWQKNQQRLAYYGVHAKMCILPAGYKDLAECPREIRGEFINAIWRS